MRDIQVLWIDDEIDLLKPHILFLEQKQYKVTTCSNGTDAVDLIDEHDFDVVFLDENMPGLSGLETLTELKEKRPNLPVIMITKSEEEYIMEEAIGSKIADFLIKPVNPNQILLSLKKTLDHSRLISEKTSVNYQKEFRKIALELSMVNSYEDWIILYKKLIYWELALENITDSSMIEILESQKQEANSHFFKFIKKQYKNWLTSSDSPILSYNLLKEVVFPILKKESNILLIVIDNLRYDQFRIIEPIINQFYKTEEELMYYSILPTATQYARNALFSGLMPLDMEKKYPQYWKNDSEEGLKNLYEDEFLNENLKRNGLKIKHDFIKITNLKSGKQTADNFKSYKDNDLTVIVYNFVDMISHAKTEMDVIKELAGDNKAYRSLTLSWFNNSPLLEIIQKAQHLGMKLIITTDHGTINCKNPSKVIGDKEISTNLRYKTGRSLSYESNDVYVEKNPKDIFLPSASMSSSFIFAKENLFFAYPNNYNHFVNYYKNSYQHGGISLEEMIIPCVIFVPK